MLTQTQSRSSFYDNLYALLFPVLAGCSVLLGIAVKSHKSTITNSPVEILKVSNAEFLIREPIHKEMPPPKPLQENKIPEKKIIPPSENKPEKEAIDLSEKPLMNQSTDEITTKNPEQQIVRKVYGLRKVYSTGIGSGGSLSDAVIGKLGNSITTDIDTVTATEQDIKGQVVSTTTITSSPQFLKIVKPEYSKEMLDNKAEGVVKVKVLVDIDGKVKKATILNDLGYNTGKAALKAALEMLFTPAKRGDEPVAVWIVIPVRFVLLS